MTRRAGAEKLRIDSGSVVLEAVLAVAIFVAAGMSILALVNRAGSAMESSRLESRAADLARSAMAMIEIGAAEPQSLDGPVPRGSPLLIASDDHGGQRDAAESGWELEVTVEQTRWRELSKVTVRAIKRGGDEREVASHRLVQLVGLK